MKVSGMEVSGIKIPGMEVSGIKIPGMEVSGMEVSGMEVSGIKIPGMKYPNKGTWNEKVPDLHPGLNMISYKSKIIS